MQDYDDSPRSQPPPIRPMQISHAQTHRLENNNSAYGGLMHSLGEFIGCMGAFPCCCFCPNPYHSVQQGFVGLISRFGQFYKAADPGLVAVNPVSESIRKVDVRIQIDPISRVPIMTKDNVNVTIDCVVYWHIVDVFLATFGVSDVRQALIERTQTTLRATLGGKVLQDCIENRETIAHSIEEIIAGPARSWGVKVETILIKDLDFSKDLQTSLSSAATQKRIGESKVIAAQAEVDSAKLMREAAEILNTPAAMQIRYLETMQQMSKAPGSKVVFMPTANMGMNTAMLYEQLADRKISGG